MYETVYKLKCSYYFNLLSLVFLLIKILNKLSKRYLKYEVIVILCSENGYYKVLL